MDAPNLTATVLTLGQYSDTVLVAVVVAPPGIEFRAVVADWLSSRLGPLPLDGTPAEREYGRRAAVLWPEFLASMRARGWQVYQSPPSVSVEPFDVPGAYD